MTAVTSCAVSGVKLSVACDALVTQCLWSGGRPRDRSSFRHGMMGEGKPETYIGLVAATELRRRSDALEAQHDADWKVQTEATHKGKVPG